MNNISQLPRRTRSYKREKQEVTEDDIPYADFAYTARFTSDDDSRL